jgi:hypothetical protein
MEVTQTKPPFLSYPSIISFPSRLPVFSSSPFSSSPLISSSSPRHIPLPSHLRFTRHSSSSTSPLLYSIPVPPTITLQHPQPQPSSNTREWTGVRQQGKFLLFRIARPRLHFLSHLSIFNTIHLLTQQPTRTPPTSARHADIVSRWRSHGLRHHQDGGS